MSYSFASFDSPSLMIDRNYTVIAEEEQFRCIFLEKIIT